MTAKSWFDKLGAGVAGTESAGGHSMVVSYLLGDKKSVKIIGIVNRFLRGPHNFHKTRNEFKSSGIA